MIETKSPKSSIDPLYIIGSGSTCRKQWWKVTNYVYLFTVLESLHFKVKYCTSAPLHLFDNHSYLLFINNHKAILILSVKFTKHSGATLR